MKIKSEINLKFVKRLSGFSLIEVLVALFVLSVGLLGFAGLQATTVRSTQYAEVRSQATVMAQDIVERMRVNRARALAGDYDLALSDATPTGSTSCIVSSGGCSLAQLVVADQIEWRTLLTGLPNGNGSIVVDAANNLATIVVQWDQQDVVDAIESTLTLVAGI